MSDDKITTASALHIEPNAGLTRTVSDRNRISTPSDEPSDLRSSHEAQRFERLRSFLCQFAGMGSEVEPEELSSVLATLSHNSDIAEIEGALTAFKASLNCDQQNLVRHRIIEQAAIHIREMFTTKHFNDLGEFLREVDPILSPPDRDAISSNIQGLAYAHEIDLEIDIALIGFSLAASLRCSLKEPIAQRIFELQAYKLRNLFEKEAFEEIDIYLRQVRGTLSSRACQSLSWTFVELAYSHEVANDFEKALIGFRLAASIESDKQVEIRQKIEKLEDIRLAQFLETGDIDRAKEAAGQRGGGVLNIYDTTSVKWHCLASGYPYVETRGERPIRKPRLRFLEDPLCLDSRTGCLVAPPQYYAEIRDCIGYASTNVIFSRSRAVSDLASNPNVSDIIIADNHRQLERFIRPLYDGAQFVEIRSVEAIEVPAGLQMFGAQSHKYGHWFCEFLPRMLVFDTPAVPPELPIYVDGSMPATHREVLELLNSQRRPVIEIPSGPVHFGRLGIAPVPALFPLDLKPGKRVYDTVWPNDIFKALRDKIVGAVAARRTDGAGSEADHGRDDPPKSGRRLFISRRGFQFRQLLNEQEIFDHLAPLGFELIQPEKLTFSEQVELFQGAAIVVGSCSSALTNCLFCNPGSTVIGLIHDDLKFNFRGYASFIEAGGSKMIFLRGKSAPDQTIHSFHKNYQVPLEKIDRALREAAKPAGAPADDLVFDAAQLEAADTIFDSAYLHRRFTEVGGDLNIDSYRTGNWALQVDPSPLFDTRYYLSQLPNALPSGLSPLDHFVLEGADLGLNPSSLFDTQFYKAAHPEVVQLGLNPLAHYLVQGLWNGSSSVPLDTPDLRHRVQTAGASDGVNPHVLGWVAALHLLDGDREAATSIVTSVTDRDSLTIIARTSAAAVYRGLDERGRAREAKVAFAHILSWGQEVNPLFHARLAKILVDWGLLDEAEQYLRHREQAKADIDPQARQMLLALSNDRQSVEERILRAKERWRTRPAEAWQLLSQAALIRPDLVPTHQSIPLPEHAQKTVSGNGLPRRDVRPGRNKRLLVLDTSFPSGVSSFRFGEYNKYLKYFPKSEVHSSIWDIQHYIGNKNFLDIHDEFTESHPEIAERVKMIHALQPMNADVYYTVFLNNAINLWHSNPRSGTGRFVFTLYPGGGFLLGCPKSDTKLRTILDDGRTAKVITTQRVTYEYLISGGFCTPDRISHIFGGVVPSCLNPSQVPREDRRTGPLNICFVAQRYTGWGSEKGCDVYVDLINKLKHNENFCFHFVGDWNSKIVGVDAAADVQFHGVRPLEFFPSFYRTMDVIVSPNISSFELNGVSGSFDGFPTTTCVEAAVEGVALFLTDSLGLNRTLDGKPIFQEGVEFERIERDADSIADLLLQYSRDRAALRALGENGRAAMFREFSFDRQIRPRLDVIEGELARA